MGTSISIIVAEVALFGSNILISYLLSGSSNAILGLLNTQQLTTHASLIQNVNFPANANLMNQVLITISSFEPVDSAHLVNEVMMDMIEPEVEPFNAAFE